METTGPFAHEGDNEFWNRIFDEQRTALGDAPDQIVTEPTAAAGELDTSMVTGSPNRGMYPEQPLAEDGVEPAADPEEPAAAAAVNQSGPTEAAPEPMAADRGGNDDEPPSGPIEAPPAADDPEPNDPTGEPTVEATVAAEIADTEQLIRSSAEEVVTAIEQAGEAGEAEHVRSLALRDLAESIIETDGPAAGHTFLEDAAERLNVPPAEMVAPWTGAYASGDAAALPEARRAIGLASEQFTLAEAIGGVELRGHASAERLVSLVEAGDSGNLATARGMIRNVPITHRAELLARLYAAGDDASLGLALEAARDVRRHLTDTGALESGRSERALEALARSAIARNKPEDATQAIAMVGRPTTQALLHAELFRNGHRPSLTSALNYIDDNPNTPTSHSVERLLAEGGYGPAAEAVRRRVAASERTDRLSLFSFLSVRDVTPRLEDLTTLHRLGDPFAAGRATMIVRASNDQRYYFDHLRAVGRHDEVAALAREHYDAFPSHHNGRRLLDATYDRAVWQDVFRHALHQQLDFVQAAEFVRYLGHRLRALKDPEETGTA